MLSSIKRLLTPIAILTITGFILFVINQIAGIYLLVAVHSQVAANILLGVLIALTITLLTWPLVVYLKLPKPLKFPKRAEELPQHRLKLIKRLRSNRILQSDMLVPNDDTSLASAITHLDNKAHQIIKDTAKAVFLTTSISQNGKLDALTILATQSRMVWKIAHIYYQRPTLRELTYLYAYVATSSFLASEIEDMDISQQLEPVLTSFLKNSAGKSLPIIGPTATIVVDSLLEGSTNAFLTLRVGNIAKKYCGCNEVLNKRSIRNQAFSESANQLKGIVAKSSGDVITELIKATQKAGIETLKSSWEGVKNTGTKLGDQFSEVSKKINPFQKKNEILEAPETKGP